MKILQFIGQLGTGGAEKFCVELSNEMARQNEVLLISATKIEPEMIPPRKLAKDVKLIQLNSKKKSLMGFFQIFRILRREKPDIVHIHSSLLVFFFSILVIFFKRIKFTHTIHSTITPAYQKLFNYLNKIRFLSKDLHHVCISSASQREYQSKYPKLHFYKIDNGIAPMTTTPQLADVQEELKELKEGRDYLFVSIGNYSTFKNFTMLVEVIKRLNRKGCRLSLIILGDDKSKDQEQWNRVKLSKDDHTHQLGLRSNVADYLFCADALIMSSLQEGVPLVVLEAMALGTAVISTPTGGVVDKIQPGFNGFLAKGFEVEDMERAILAFIKSTPPTRQKKPIESDLHIPFQYSMTKCAGEYLDLYTTLRKD